MSGLQGEEPGGPRVGSFPGGYMYRVTDRFLPIWLDASFEAGNAWQASSEAMGDTLIAGSVFVGWFSLNLR